MKKSVIIICLSLLSVALSAQQQSLGVQIGFDRPLIRENNITTTNKLGTPTSANGFKVGLVYDASLVKGFGFSLGVNYNLAANKSAWTQESTNFTAKKRQTSDLIQTIEIPIDWQYKFSIAQQTYLILYSGPVIQYNFMFKHSVSHKNEVDNTLSTDIYNHYSADNQYDNGSKYADRDQDNKADYSPLNLQWSIGAGFQYKNYFLRGGYNFGIYNHYKDQYYTNPDGTTEYRMRGRWDEWNIRVGIYFLNF